VLTLFGHVGADRATSPWRYGETGRAFLVRFTPVEGHPDADQIRRMPSGIDLDLVGVDDRPLPDAAQMELGSGRPVAVGRDTVETPFDGPWRRRRQQGIRDGAGSLQILDEQLGWPAGTRSSDRSGSLGWVDGLDPGVHVGDLAAVVVGVGSAGAGATDLEVAGDVRPEPLSLVDTVKGLTGWRRDAP
jgi:hypothetical protein